MNYNYCVHNYCLFCVIYTYGCFSVITTGLVLLILLRYVFNFIVCFFNCMRTPYNMAVFIQVKSFLNNNHNLLAYGHNFI